MPDISVRELRREVDATSFLVTVAERGSRTTHEVRVSDADLMRLVGPGVPADELVRRSFMFLLDREPKESILTSFDITAIARYYPEYPARVRAI